MSRFSKAIKRVVAPVKAAYHKEIELYKSPEGQQALSLAGAAIGIPPQVTQGAFAAAGGQPVTAQQGKAMFDFLSATPSGGTSFMPPMGTNLLKGNPSRPSAPALRQPVPGGVRRVPGWG